MTRPTDPRPLVVSLELDAAHQQRFDAERRMLFPTSAVGAHVTLFHALPADLLDDARERLAAAAAREPLDVTVSALVPLGRGVAYRLESAGLVALHAGLQRRWRASLTRQDAQGFRPHVTVQNKVAPEVAAATLTRLRAAFAPSRAVGIALELWRYVGGPWEPLDRFPFAAG